MQHREQAFRDNVWRKPLSWSHAAEVRGYTLSADDIKAVHDAGYNAALDLAAQLATALEELKTAAADVDALLRADQALANYRAAIQPQEAHSAS